MDYSVSLAPVYYQAQGEDGPYTASAIVIECSDERGQVWQLAGTPMDWSEERAARLRSKIQDHVDATPDWEPGPYWFATRSLYGSRLHDETQLYDDAEREHYLGR